MYVTGTPSPLRTPTAEHTDRSSSGRRSRRQHFRTAARIVQLEIEAKKLAEAARKQKKVSDLVHTQRKEQTHYDLSMRRSTIAEVISTRDVHRRRSSGTQRPVQNRKQSMGSTLDMERTRVSTLPRQNAQPKPIAQSKSSSSQLLNLAVREEVQRRRLMEKLKFVVRFGVLMRRWWKKHSHTEVSQTHPFYMQYQMINDLSENHPEHGIEFKASYFKANKQMRMSQEARRILMMAPENRTKEEVYYAMIALRGIDCIADYPLRMQEALARHGLFQSFDSKRIIVKQGHAPLFFYFILYGTVVVATLDSGEPYAKTRVTLRRGENFGELAIAHRIPRQSTVLTMENTEFLTIDCDTYENIFMAGGVKTIHDPDHNNFMRFERYKYESYFTLYEEKNKLCRAVTHSLSPLSMFFLREWPLEKLQANPKAMEFCYFRRNTVMVKDSNTSEWIYIVKSGSLRVYKKLVRCYPTVNIRTGNYDELAHTDGYQCFMSQESEYHRYAMYNHVELPPPLSPDTDSEDEDHIHTCVIFKTGGISEEKENLLALPLMQRVERLIRPRTASGGVIATYGHSKFNKAKRNIQSAKSDVPRLLKLAEVKTQSPRTASSFSTASTADTRLDLSSATPDNQGKRTLMDDFESSSRLKNAEHKKKLLTSEPDRIRLHKHSDVNPNAISTRHHVFVTDVKKEVTAADLDPEFVLVQTLTKGQAFGIQQVLLEDQPSMILVSGGAECVMLNKKFYREQINPNMMQKLKQQISPFPTDKDLQKNLQIRVNWLKYKQVTLHNLMSSQRNGKPPRKTLQDKTLVFK